MEKLIEICARGWTSIIQVFWLNLTKKYTWTVCFFLNNSNYVPENQPESPFFAFDLCTAGKTAKNTNSLFTSHVPLITS